MPLPVVICLYFFHCSVRQYVNHDFGSQTKCVDKSLAIGQHDLFCPAADTVHVTNPFHLVGGFERFSHAFLLGHLASNQVDTLLTSLINLQQMWIQFSGQQ